jgi:hypothetical protein
MAGCKWLILLGPLRSLLIAGQNLVCVGRAGNREQRQNRNDGQRFHGGDGRARLWPKTSELGAFSGRSGETIMAAPQFAATFSVSLFSAKATMPD